MPDDTQQIRTITLWLNAFIPEDLEGAKYVLGKGEHGGKTMFPSPGPIDAWFLTDQRGFSSDKHAHARMHSEIEIDVQKGIVVNELHKCDETTEVDVDTGEEKCRESADTSNMKFSNFQVSDEGVITVNLDGSTHNACLKVTNIPVSPNLDYTGSITIVLFDAGSQASIAFEGRIETYPAFEMYASVNNGSPKIIFQEAIVPGATPVSLVGPALRSISYQAEV